jgi:hypothetical protein
VEDAETFLKAVGGAFDLPDYDGGSFERLRDELATVSAEGHPGIVFLWDGWSPLARHDEQAFATALSLFRDRARSSAGDTLGVILRGDGPDLDVPELPDGPH